MKKQPLAEVFGFPINNLAKDAERFRKNKLCPFHKLDDISPEAPTMADILSE